MLTTDFMEKVSEKAKKEFHVLTNGKWSVIHAQAYKHWRVGDDKFYFVVREIENRMFRFEMYYSNGNKKELDRAFLIFTETLEENKIDAITFKYGLGSSFEGSGEKSRYFLSLLKKLGVNYPSWNGQITAKNKRLDYDAIVKLDYNNTVMTITQRSYDKNSYYSTNHIETKITNENELNLFLQKRDDYLKETIIREKEFLPLIHQYDKTAYVNEVDLMHFIYKKSYALYIKRIKAKSGKETYRGRLNSKYIQSKDLDTLIERMKTELTKFLVKNRINAAVQGRTSNFIDTFLYEIYDQRKLCTNFTKTFDSTVGEGDLNYYLKDHIHSVKKESLSKEMVTSFQEQLRGEGKRNRIKAGYKYGELYVFISGTKLHIRKENEINLLEEVS